MSLLFPPGTVPARIPQGVMAGCRGSGAACPPSRVAPGALGTRTRRRLGSREPSPSQTPLGASNPGSFIFHVSPGTTDGKVLERRRVSPTKTQGKALATAPGSCLQVTEG